jgi:transcriptional regulator with XRE-family HTH domain
MQNDAARRRQALERFMQAHGLNRGSLARRAAISPNIVYNFLKGRSHYLSQPTLEKIAATFGVPLGDILGEAEPATARSGLAEAQGLLGRQQEASLSSRPVALPVIGEIRGNGVWSTEIFLPVEGEESAAFDIPTLYAEKSFAVRAGGPALGALLTGEVILGCVPVRAYLQRLSAGDIVIMVRQNALGLFETTVKQYEIEGARHFLTARSADPRFNERAELHAPLEQPLADGYQDFFIHSIVLHYSAKLPAARR